MIKKIFLFLLLLTLKKVIHAQTPANDDCINAINLCHYTNSSSSISNSNPELLLPASLCFTSSNGVWFKFKAIDNGNASVVISNLVANNSNGELQAAIISFTNPCDFTSALILDCNSGTNAGFTLAANGLTQNQTYYVLVDGGDLQAPPLAQINFDIKDTGSAVRPSAQITKINASCNLNNGSIVVKNVKLSNYPYTYKLNGGASQTDSTFSNLGTGNYSITVTDANGCSFNLASSISNSSIASIQPVSTSANCATQQKGKIVVNVLPTNSSYTYSLNGASSQSSNTFNNVIAGTHTVTISGFGCDTTVLVIVSQVGGITAAIGQTNTINCGATNGTITYPNPIQPPAPAGTQYVFQLLNSGLPPNITGTFTNLPAGTYLVEILNSNVPTCVYTDRVSIQQLSGPVVDSTFVVNENCGNGTGNISVKAMNGVKPYSFSIDGGTSQSSNIFSNLKSGSYNVEVKDANGCVDNKVVTVSNKSPGTFTNCSAGDDKVIILGDKASVDVTVPSGAVITWLPGSASEGLVENTYKLYPTVSTNYTMTATLSNGCVCKSSVRVEVKPPIDIPNTFTPNGDGKNDKFLIYFTENFRNVEITIFDRWGTKVYFTNSYTPETAWDGTANGSKVPIAAYYYILKFSFPESSNDDNSYYYEGSISLIR